jgi:NAD(P)-dependent dehydrogenase (short-subunit alcohol dehydrogenase family)
MIADRYRPTIVIAGRSPLPDDESPSTAGLTSAPELKAALMDSMRKTQSEVALPQVEAAYRRTLNDRELRDNLARMRGSGATVRYEQVDVRDAAAMAQLVRQIEREFGRLDGVIHGAGIVEDKLVENKSPESFDRVFDTKADGAFVLSRVLHPETLKFFVLFSSVVGAFGNRGQADYAAANAVLSELAIRLDACWPGRVVAIGWGPWTNTGMVSAELARHFEEQGAQLIEVQAGCHAVDDELRRGSKGEGAVVVAAQKSKPRVDVGSGARSTNGGSGPSPIPRFGSTDKPTLPLPLVHLGRCSRHGDGTIEVIRTLDPAHDLYLRDHELDGKPVLPMTMALEFMAEVAQQGWPGLQVASVRDFHVLRGVVLSGGQRTIRVAARAQGGPPLDEPLAVVSVEITDPDAPDRPLYRAAVELAQQLPEPPAQLERVGSLPSFPMSVEEAYRRWLFHGPIFRGIVAIEGMDDRHVTATLVSSSPRQCLAVTPVGAWLIDPVVVDSGLQLMLLWCRAQLDTTPLPSAFRRYRRFGSMATPEIHAVAELASSPDGHTVHGTLSFLGSNGQLVGVLEGLEATADRALNRLATRVPAARESGQK